MMYRKNKLSCVISTEKRVPTIYDVVRKYVYVINPYIILGFQNNVYLIIAISSFLKLYELYVLKSTSE